MQQQLSDIDQPTIVSVAIAVPLRRCFEYLVPAKLTFEPTAGMRVKVPFGRTTQIGVVVKVTHGLSEQSEISLEKLKTVIAFIDHQPLLNQKLLNLYSWMQKYYHAPPGEIWQTLLPNALMKGEPTELSRSSYWLLTQQGQLALSQNGIPKNAVKQHQVLSYLAQNPQGLPHDSLSTHHFNYATLKALAGKKWVEQKYLSESDKPAHHSPLRHQHHAIQLNSQQQKAVEQVENELSNYAAFLLFGVTASGKTEVYLRLIESVLKQNKQALVLVPEIGLTPQTLKRFQDRFNVEIVLLHSAMTDKQRLQSWLKARQGSARIIIGTRSALFTPLKAPGIIIIDEEHDKSFRQQQGFRYSARDVALVRAHLEQIPVLLGSATPSMETLHNVAKGKIRQLDLPQKAQTSIDLKYRIIDLKQQVLNQGLSSTLIESVKKHLQQKGQVLLFLNRRGYAPVLLCHECGWSPICQRCDIHFTYHHQNHFLQCHHCGASRKAPTQCSQCGCQQMVPVGLGTERLQETIHQIFPEAKIARIDRDTTRRKSAMQDFVSAVKAGDVDILVGTQMLAKGHHFPDVTLVGLIDMDGALYSADFRAPEYAAQLITQVSGRAGRADKAGEVLIQTHHASHPMLHQVIHSGYEEFAKSSLPERQQAELPPYAFQALFQAESPQINSVKAFLGEVRQILDRYSNLKVELLGPVPAVYAKKAGKFRFQLLMQTDSRNQLHQLLDLTLADIEQLKSASKVRWRLEIDPIIDS